MISTHQLPHLPQTRQLSLSYRLPLSQHGAHVRSNLSTNSASYFSTNRTTNSAADMLSYLMSDVTLYINQ
jgi:hypothetical protein